MDDLFSLNYTSLDTLRKKNKYRKVKTLSRICNCTFKSLILLSLLTFVISTVYVIVEFKDPVKNLINQVSDTISFHNQTIYNIESDLTKKINNTYDIILLHNNSIHGIESEITQYLKDTYAVLLSHNKTVTSLEKLLSSDLRSFSGLMKISNQFLMGFNKNYNNKDVTYKILNIIDKMQNVVTGLNSSELQSDIHTIACDLNIMLNKTMIC